MNDDLRDLLAKAKGVAAAARILRLDELAPPSITELTDADLELVDAAQADECVDRSRQR